MEHSIFKKEKLKKPAFFDKLLGVRMKENALVEINNLLAEKDLGLITVEEIQHIASYYNLNLNARFQQELMEMYKQYLKSCLEDKYLSDEELADLKQLKFLLGLSDKDVEEAHQEMAGEIYKAEVEKVIEDRQVDEAERVFMQKLQNDLKLPKEIADSIYKKTGDELVKSVVNDALADQMLTPEEEKELSMIANNLNTALDLDGQTRANLEKYKLFWQIQNDELPEIEADIEVPRKEKIYFKLKVRWFEHIEEQEQSTYTKSNLKVKIAKGDYWNTHKKDNFFLDPKTWEMLDEGELYLTSKRLMLKGVSRDKILLLNRVLDFVVYPNGIEIDKERGNKDIFLAADNNTDVLTMLLGKAIANLY